MTYDEFDCEFDDLLDDLRNARISEAEFQRSSELLQNRWEEECEE